MSRSKTTNVLADPEIQRHTQRILALQTEERQAREKLGQIIAAMGAELMAVKEALDALSVKTAWLRWLKDHVHYSADTAQRYMRVARFSEKNRNVAEFFELDPSVLYRIPPRRPSRPPPRPRPTRCCPIRRRVATWR